MKKQVLATVLCGIVLTPAVYARDLDSLILPMHQGKWTTSVLYEHMKLSEDFDTRGNADFSADAVGTQLTYGITDQIAVGIKGASLINTQESAQGATWQGRSGFLYGMDLYNEVFPATEVRPGVQASIGATGFQTPLDRLNSGGTTTLIDQNMTGIDYHASVLLSMKFFNRIQPYTGIRVFGRSVTWSDNQSATDGGPDHIVGHAHGNASIVVGMPVQITPDLRLELAGAFISETTLTAGLTIAAF